MAWHLAHRCLLLEAAVALTCACAELPAVARERVGGGAVDEAGGAVEEEADSPDWESLSSCCAHSALSSRTVASRVLVRRPKRVATHWTTIASAVLKVAERSYWGNSSRTPSKWRRASSAVTVKLSGVEMVEMDAVGGGVIDYVKNKGALRGTEGRLLRKGPESGIVDGESPSISLPYIDRTGYKCTNTCAYMVSTESVCHQLGSCLVARYLFPTLPLKQAALQLRGLGGWGGAMLPSIAGRLVAPPAELLSIGDERCVEALRGERQGIGLRVCGKGGCREEGGEWT